MKFKPSFAFFSLILCNLAFAKEWSPPDHGFLIQAETPNGVAQKPGQSSEIHGQVKLVTGPGTKGDLSKKSVQELLFKDGVQIQAFFPDQATEVTSSLILRDTGNHLQFSLNTPPLTVDAPNVFTLIVIHPHEDAIALRKIQGKLDRRISALNVLLAQGSSRGKPTEQVQAELAKLRDKLQAISDRIQQKLAMRVEQLAELKFPLQVGNVISQPSSNSTVMAKFRFNISYDVGSQIQGGKAKVKSTILNLRKADESSNTESPSGLWLARFFWQGGQIKEIGPQSIPNGTSVDYEFQTAKLNPSDDNTFSTELFSWDSKSRSAGKRFGHLAFLEPVAPDTLSPVWLAGSTPDAQHPYIKNMQLVSAQVRDEFGFIDPASFRATLSGSQVDGVQVNQDVTSRLQYEAQNQGSQYSVTGNLNQIAEGQYSFSISAKDLTGNAAQPDPLNATFRIDRTAPSITLGLQDHIITNSPNLDLPITVLDASPTLTKVSLNGTVVQQSDSPSFNVPLLLNDGLNSIEVASTDAAGNEATPVKLVDVILDRVAPILSNLVPADGSILSSLNISISGKSNESLESATVNGLGLTLSEDKKSFSGTLVAQKEGNFGLQLEAIDFAGNSIQKDITVQIVLKVLNGDLLSVIPDNDQTHLLIVGAPGATRPGLTVSASSSFFNRGQATAAADGSFSIKLAAFTQATVTATDPSIGRTDSATVSFGSASGTRLSGMVKDTSGNPLLGARVSLSGTGMSAQTDASGVFVFSDPASGDQVLEVDGTAIASDPNGPARKFSITSVSINVGIGQSNVLERPIFLAPIPLDGRATSIDKNVGGVVTSQDAPGVSLDIPAGSVSFPDGRETGSIYMATIPAQFSTIETPEYASPSHVVALEPSGLSFSEPVQLTLPNSDQLPPGVELVVMSLNSRKGIWEINGVAVVTDDGSSIVTKAGMGITHFSMVYATPVGPKISQIGAQDKPGANTFDGALSTSINLPSYKSLGQDITPSLIYKSSWARPTVLVTNLFDIPREEINISYSGGGGIGTLFRKEVTESVQAWYEPDRITAQFSTTGILGEKLTYTGVPNKAALSFSMELKNPSTGQYLLTDVYPYSAQYEVYLKQTVIRTRKTERRRWFGKPQVTQDTYVETRQIEQAFPSDLTGPIYVQNEMISPAGRGWTIAGIQKIPNPTGDRVFIQEADGSIASYAVNNTITTLFDATGKGANLSLGVDLNSWPFAHITLQGSSNSVARIDLTNPTSSVTALGSLPALTGTVVGNNPYIHHITGSFFSGFQFWVYCDHYHHPYTLAREPSQLFALPGGPVVGVDQKASNVFKVENQTMSLIAGQQVPTDTLFHPGWSNPGAGVGYPNSDANMNYCVNTIGTTCGGYSITLEEIPWPQASCPAVYSSGERPAHGFADGSLPSSQLNRPLGISSGPTPNTLLVADTGNNRVRLINLNDSSIRTFAGNGSQFYTGDGKLATEVGIFHPRGVTSDAQGNAYISAEGGQVYKVDPTGRIVTLVGKDPDASPGDNLPASRVLLNRPYGMVVDNGNGYLYIAETNGHTVRRFDLQTHHIQSVAGNFSPGYNGDDIAALNASLMFPTHLGLDPDGNLLIADSGNQRIRRVTFQNTSSGTIAFAPTSQDHSTLSRRSDGSWLRKYRDGNQIEFDSAGRQISQADRAGRVVTYTYDSATGNLSTVTDAAGRQIQYFYSSGKLTSILDPAGRATSFNYTGDYLTQVVFPDGNKRNYSYNEKGLLAAETNERGLSTQYAYNQWNRLATVSRADGSSITVNDSGSATAGNNFTGGNVGQLQSFGAGSGQAYDGIKDAKSIETKFVKDTLGYITTIIDGLGHSTVIKRDEKGKPTLITRPDGSTVSFTYDPNTDDLLSQVDTANGITISQTYDSFGNPLTQTNGRGFTSVNEYDPVTGLLASKRNPLGHATNYAYASPLKLVSSVTNPLGKTVSYNYDASGNLISVTDPLGRSTSHTRDAAGNILSTTNALGQTTRYEYDPFNRLTAVITPKNERTEYAYLASGELAQIKDPLGNITTFEYDALGRLTKKTDPLGFIVTRSYDQNGNLAQEIDPNGNIKKYNYDNLNQLIQKILPDNTISLAYDVRGNLRQARNLQSQVDFEMDTAGRVLSASSQGLGAHSGLPNIVLNYDYDKNGNRISLQDPIGQTSYVYDRADRLVSLTNPKGETYQFSYDAGNRLKTVHRPGSQTAFDFDDNNFVSSIVHSSGGLTLSSFGLVRNNIGNITQLRTPGIAKSFGYDDNNQLISASNPEASGPLQNEAYSYDPIANRTGDQSGNYTYDAKSQRLIEDYRYLYVFDNNGNMITKQAKGLTGEVTNFSYSSENQLLSFKVYVPGSSSPAKEVTYTYDALGRRIQKQVVDHTAPSDPLKSFTRRYVYDGQEILLEYGESNQLLARYTHSTLRTDDALAVDVTSAGVDAKLAQSSGSYQYLKDHQGSITDIADNGGNRIQRFIYSAFGELVGIKDALTNDVTAQPPLNTSYSYTGRERDTESGLYYYRARYYDPGIGRFLQKDPHPGKIDYPVTVINSYSYAVNSPQLFTDPSGKFIWFLAAAVVIGAAVGGTWSALQGGNILQGMALGALGGLITAAGAVGGLWAGGIIAGQTLAFGTVGATISAGLGAGLAAGTWNVILGGGGVGFAVGFTFGFIGGAIFGAGVTLPTGSEALGPHEPPTTIPQPKPSVPVPPNIVPKPIM